MRRVPDPSASSDMGEIRDTVFPPSPIIFSLKRLLVGPCCMFLAFKVVTPSSKSRICSVYARDLHHALPIDYVNVSVRWVIIYRHLFS
jgi:hypothetical protein